MVNSMICGLMTFSLHSANVKKSRNTNDDSNGIFKMTMFNETIQCQQPTEISLSRLLQELFAAKTPNLIGKITFKVLYLRLQFLYNDMVPKVFKL